MARLFRNWPRVRIRSGHGPRPKTALNVLRTIADYARAIRKFRGKYDVSQWPERLRVAPSVLLRWRNSLRLTLTEVEQLSDL